MSAFFEFCHAHPWQIAGVLFVVASISMTIGFVIASILAPDDTIENKELAEILRGLDNPANVSRRIEKR